MDKEQAKLMLFRALQSSDFFVEAVEYFETHNMADPLMVMDFLLEGLRKNPEKGTVILNILETLAERGRGVGAQLGRLLEKNLEDISSLYYQRHDPQQIEEWVEFLSRLGKSGVLSLEGSEKARLMALHRLDILAREAEIEEVIEKKQEHLPITRVMQHSLAFELYQLDKTHATLIAKIDEISSKITAEEANIARNKTQSILTLTQHRQELEEVRKQLMTFCASLLTGMERVAAFTPAKERAVGQSTETPQKLEELEVE